MNKNRLNKAVSLTFATILFTGCAHLEFDDDEPAAFNHAKTETQPPSQPRIMPSPVLMKVSNNQLDRDCSVDGSNYDHYLSNDGKKANAIKVRVTGYGAPPKAFYPDPQRRLMAMRAAKIDAYRNLAERVAGLQIWGGTTIGDMVVEKDRFRVYLDTHISGARVIAESGQEDGTFETVVELKVDQFFLNQALPRKRSNVDCGDNSRHLNVSSAKQTMDDMPGNLRKSNFYFQD